MGIVLKQGFKNTIYTYLGFIIGGIYTVLLVPKVFDSNPEHWGTTRYLVSFAMIVAPWAQLSLPNIIIRYFPILKEKKLKEFLSFIFFWAIAGILISSMILFILFKYQYITNSNELLAKTIFLVFPIFIGFVLFEIGTALSKSLLKSTVPVFLKEVLLRANVFVLIILYWYNIISFSVFIYAYAFNYILVFVILYSYLYKLKIFRFKLSVKFIRDKAFNPLYVYGAFSILSSGAAMILLNIDTLMINHYLTLKDVAIYGPSIFIASSIMIPSRALQSIISPVIAQSWATKSMDTISKIYKKSAISPLVITNFLFLLIWINIDLVMAYFGKTFGQGKYIILFLSMGHIVNIATGINGTIINTSKHYRADLYFQIGLVLMTIIMNVIFIPKFGINGAALATGITLGLHNVSKSIFVWYKFNIHPFSKKTIYALVIVLIFFLAITKLPTIGTLMINAIIYTLLTTFLYWILVYVLNISEDINEQINKLRKKLF
ncbi:MAG: polysaccharide biosynthesis C-terminal domain-containing protein [Salinivirgaceae bacterium]|nr:polysaccharide biosynthesis C-terminal domain-containing protein [Salinivirgaceae bacterium]